jgi:hypothetical protein
MKIIIMKILIKFLIIIIMLMKAEMLMLIIITTIIMLMIIILTIIIIIKVIIKTMKAESLKNKKKSRKLSGKFFNQMRTLRSFFKNSKLISLKAKIFLIKFSV